MSRAVMDLFTYQPRYPAGPGFKRRDTSYDAAKEIERRAPRLQRECLDQLLLYGPMTADECATNLGMDKLSIRPRFSELATLGKIADTGERRRNTSGKLAVVWKRL